MKRQLVVIAGDDIGREVIPLAVQCIRALLPNTEFLYMEAGAGHARRIGNGIERATLDTIEEVGAALVGPLRSDPNAPSVLEELVTSLDLYAALYPVHAPERATTLLLVVPIEGPGRSATSRSNGALTPLERWMATRLGNLVAQLARKGSGKVTIAHDDEAWFVEAVRAGIGDQAPATDVTVGDLLQQLRDHASTQGILLAGTTVGERILATALNSVSARATTGRLLVGSKAVVAMPAHGTLREQVEWGFANPTGAMNAAVALLRYGWAEETAARRLERAIDAVSKRRRTPDLGGVHTMHEVTRAVLEALRSIS